MKIHTINGARKLKKVFGDNVTTLFEVQLIAGDIIRATIQFHGDEAGADALLAALDKTPHVVICDPALAEYLSSGVIYS